jgi:hypothetical protein
VRYWKGAYDEDSARELELRRSAALVADRLETESPAPDDDKRALGIFHALVAVQILMAAVAALLSLAELLASSQ